MTVSTSFQGVLVHEEQVETVDDKNQVAVV